MLKKFKVSNYKNFNSEIEIDFSSISGYKFSDDCISRDMISKMIIYGRNAVGKTNFGRAITDLLYTLNPSSLGDDKVIKHAGSPSSKTKFTYVFLFNEKRDEVTYTYEKESNNKLVYEVLTINDEFVYELDHYKNDFSNVNFKYFEKISAINYINLKNNSNDKTVPFLSWLSANASIDHNSPIYKIYDFSRKIIMINNPFGAAPLYDQNTLSTLENDLNGLTEFLNDMGVKCNLKIFTLPEGTKELYFVFDNEEYVKFDTGASSGTASLFNFYVSFIMNKAECSLLYFDEFDAYFHHEMSELVLKYLKKKFKDSLAIITTHNTNLMSNELMRPDCLFILSSYGKLTPLNKATERELREGHNLEKMYIAGEFDKYE